MGVCISVYKSVGHLNTSGSPCPARCLERLAEQSALMEKAQSRVNELEQAQVMRLQRITKRAGFLSVDVSDDCIEQALRQAMEKASTSDDPESVISEKQRRESRVYQQNRARVERAKRSIQRLKKEERRRDASQKWQLGNLLEMAGIASITMEALDEKLSVIHAGLAKSGVRERWQARGFELLQQQKTVRQKMCRDIVHHVVLALIAPLHIEKLPWVDW